MSTFLLPRQVWHIQMLIRQVCYRLATIKEHSETSSFVIQQNTKDVATFELREMLPYTHVLNVNFSTIRRLQRCFKEFGSTCSIMLF